MKTTLTIDQVKAILAQSAHELMKAHEEINHSRFTITPNQLYERFRDVRDDVEVLGLKIDAVCDHLGITLQHYPSATTPSHYKAVGKWGSK